MYFRRTVLYVSRDAKTMTECPGKWTEYCIQSFDYWKKYCRKRTLKLIFIISLTDVLSGPLTETDRMLHLTYSIIISEAWAISIQALSKNMGACLTHPNISRRPILVIINEIYFWVLNKAACTIQLFGHWTCKFDESYLAANRPDVRPRGVRVYRSPIAWIWKCRLYGFYSLLTGGRPHSHIDSMLRELLINFSFAFLYHHGSYRYKHGAQSKIYLALVQFCGINFFCDKTYSLQIISVWFLGWFRKHQETTQKPCLAWVPSRQTVLSHN